MNAISKTPGAERDLLRQANYLEETASLEAAERFYDAAERAFADLAEMPGMGRRKETNNPHLKDLRQLAYSRLREAFDFLPSDRSRSGDCSRSAWSA